MPALNARGTRRAGSAGLAGLLALGLLLLGLAVPATAAADTQPTSGTPATAAADALPTVQTNGVVWSMVTVGNTVYATGSFTTATPPGGGTGVARGNLLAFDIRTGQLIAGFDHTLNGQGRIIVASPDGSRVYVGGDFTTVDGAARGHVAAFDVATGNLVPGFAPNASGRVFSLAATASTVYVGGEFTVAGGQPRVRLAAFGANNGALTSWAPTADHIVRGIVIDPTGTRIVLAGQFSQINGIEAFSIASVDTAGGDARSQPYGIDNHGDPSGAFSLKLFNGVAYATIYGFVEGNMEGVVAFNPTNFDLVWMSDCHGDPYDTWANGSVVYNANHAHDCETAGSFPDPSPRTWQRATAMTVAATGTLTATTDLPRYTSWAGNPSPTILHFWPTIPTGSYTGQAQGAWSVTGGGEYVVFGGEFESINGRPQSGLVRFASASVAPNDRGPELSAAEMQPSATSTTAGTVKVVWPSSWDMDNEFLTYRLFRNGGTTPIHTATTSTAWWNMPQQTFTETLPGGSSASYRVTVTDPFDNVVTSAVSNTVTVAGSTSAYATQVLEDGAAQYWRLGETSGNTALDYVGIDHLTTGSGVSRGTAGAVDGDAAVTADGTAAGRSATSDTVSTPGTAFSVEAWVRTTSADGGVIAQYGEELTDALVDNTDRALYVDAGGRVSFGLSARGPAPERLTTYTTLRSPAAVTDGQWHHVVATVGTGGTTLYIDGTQVASSAAMIRANPRVGPAFWMLGSGTLTGVPEAPASASLAGSIDEAAIYPTTLTAAQVAEHFTAAGATVTNQSPTAAFDATASGLGVSVDGADSTDPDGTVASYSWNWGDSTAAGSGATATHTYAAAGTYTVTLTVTDNAGATGTATESVTVTAPPPSGPTVIADDTFNRTATNGLGTADVGGAWTAAVGGTRQSVAPGTATLQLPAAGNNTGAYLGAVSQTDTDVRTTFSLSAAPTGNGTYVYVTGRRVAANTEYRVRVRMLADGRVGLALSRLSGGTEAFPGGETVVPGLTVPNGTPVNVRVRTTGTAPTQVQAWAWTGATEPTAASITRSDATAAVQAAGAVGLTVHRPSGTTNATHVRFTSYRVTGVGGGGTPVNTPPTASFTATPSGLGVSVDGSASSDAGGSIASYAWNWGDSTAAGSGVTATHTYATAGTYTVTLTVTDDGGLTNSTTRSVTVTAAPPPAGGEFARDTFDRTAANGLGTADLGGAWTVGVGGTRQSVAPGAATMQLPTAGNNTGSYLGGVSQSSADVTTAFSLSSMPTGGGTYVYVTGRRVANQGEYRVRVRVAPNGQIFLALSRVTGTTEAFPGGELTVAGVTYTAGSTLNVRVQVSGTGTTQVTAKVWTGATEPAAPQMTRTDSTAALQAAGSVGLSVHRPGSSTAATAVRFTAFSARPVA